METKKAPEVHHNTICAFPDIPILEFYKDYFDSIYIMLHPFRKGVKATNWFSNSEKRPVKNQIIKHTEMVSWTDFMLLSGFTSISQVDIALRNYIGGLNDSHANIKDVDILKATCLEHNLDIPPEGDFSEFLTDKMLNALVELGHEWIYIGDEFGWERKIEDLENIISNQSEIYYNHESWYTIKNEVLYTSHWDSHFTLLCSDKLTIEKILTEHNFEGFYCDEKTEIYWSVKP